MLSVLMYIIGVSSDGMITGEFCCLYQTGADFAAGCSFNRCVSNVTGFSMNIGLFDGNLRTGKLNSVDTDRMNG